MEWESLALDFLVSFSASPSQGQNWFTGSHFFSKSLKSLILFGHSNGMKSRNFASIWVKLALDNWQYAKRSAAAKSRQSCPTLCDPIDGSPPGSCPWDSPGKNTGVGCHFLLQCRKVRSESEVTQSCPTLSDPMDCSLPGSPSMGFSRQEYWSGLLVLYRGDNAYCKGMR